MKKSALRRQTFLALAVLFAGIVAWSTSGQDPSFPDDAEHAERPLLVLHVGPFKTGSTALQNRLCEWRDQLAQSNVTVFTTDPSGKRCWPKAAASVALALEDRASKDAHEYVAFFAAVAGLKAGQTLVYSSEYLSNLFPNHLEPVARALRASGADIAVAAVFRRWAGRMTSWYGHNAAVSHVFFRGKTFAAFRLYVRKKTYRNLLATWLGVFPRAYVAVVSLEGSARAGIDLDAAVLASALGSRAPTWLLDASRAPGAKRTRINSRPIATADAIYAAFLEWVMLERPRFAGNASAEVWSVAARRPCAARKSAEVLRDKLPRACGSFADEARAADLEDLEALRDARRRAKGRLRLVHFAPGRKIELPAPIDDPPLNYCEVDRDKVDGEPNRYASLVAAAAAEIAASC